MSLTRTQILDGIRELIRGFYEDEVQLKPGVEQVIKLLASKDIPMIVQPQVTVHVLQLA